MTDVEPNLKTEPGFFTVPNEKDILSGLCYGQVETYYGRMDIFTNFTGYRLVDGALQSGKGRGGITGDAVTT